MFRLILLVCIFFSGKAAAFAQDILTLEKALEIGLENNFAIRFAKNDQQIGEINENAAIYNFLPTVSLTGTFQNRVEDVRQQFITDQVNNVQGALTNNYGGALNIGWTLFDGLGMFVNFQIVSEQKHFQEVNSKIAIENAIAEISTAYFTILLEGERLNVFKNSLNISEERLRIAKDKYEVGRASKLEYLAAQVDLNNDKSNLLKQEEILATTKISLNEILGRPVDVLFSTIGDIEVNDGLKLESIVESSIFHNKGMLAAQREKNVAYLQERAIWSEKLPRVSLNMGYNYNMLNSEAGFLMNSRTNGITYGLTATWNIFNGRDVARREQIAKVENHTAGLKFESLKLSLEADVNRVFIHYKNSLTLLELETENNLVAKENEEIALERYKLGVANPLELREAQVNALNAEMRRLNTSFDAKIAEIELVRLSGNILRKDG